MNAPAPSPRRRRHPLAPFFAPESIAVLGATEAEASAGRQLMLNLVSHPFGGIVYPVAPGRRSVLGVKACGSIGDIGEPVDLAIIAGPGPDLASTVDQAVAGGVGGVLICCGGFRTLGEIDPALRAAVARANEAGVRVIGPNSLGVMLPHRGLNATTSEVSGRPGNVALISQSGSLCSAILDWATDESVGFSACVSVGGMVDVGFGELLEFFGDDARTKSIVLYLESVGDARSFLSSAREAALAKPIIVLKAGRSNPRGSQAMASGHDAKAARSELAQLAGSDRVFDAVFRRTGVLRVSAVEDLFYMAEVLSKQPRPAGPRLGVVSNAGGPALLAADALLDAGGVLAELTPETRAALREELGGRWTGANPEDLAVDAGPEPFARAVELLGKDATCDGVLAIFTPAVGLDPEVTARLVTKAAPRQKPLLCSWLGGPSVASANRALAVAGIPTFTYPDAAARAFAAMWRYSYNLKGLYETPAADEARPASSPPAGREDAGVMLQRLRQANRPVLTEIEAQHLFESRGLPAVDTRHAANRRQAVELARQIGFPVVLKLHAPMLADRTPAGRARLNLADVQAVRQAWSDIRSATRRGSRRGVFRGVTVQPMILRDAAELYLGVIRDPAFGPVVVFGAGGSHVDMRGDLALALPPLNTTLARRLMEQTRIHAALRAAPAGEGIDLARLERLLVRFSQLALEPAIQEIEINPLLASGSRFIPLNARITLYPRNQDLTSLARPAIRPYPTQYAGRFSLRDGREIDIRPIRPEDEPLLSAFHSTLSEETVYYRYFHQMTLDTRTAHERLTRMCFIDYDRELALVAEHRDPVTGDRSILGVGRLMRLHGKPEGEFAIVISDEYQRQGLGLELLNRIVDVARQEGMIRVRADILNENKGMQKVCEKVGFRLSPSYEDDLVKAEIDITPMSAAD